MASVLSKFTVAGAVAAVSAASMGNVTAVGYAALLGLPDQHGAEAN